MKKQITILSFAWFILIILIQSGCSTSSSPLVFEQNHKHYVIEEESSAVSVYSPEGKLLQSVGIPAAGPITPDEQALPPANILGLIQSTMQVLLFKTGTIIGIVWNDINGDRNRNTGEPGVANVTVFLDNDNNGILSNGDLETITGPDGSFSFARLKEGTINLYIDLSTLPNGFGTTTALPYSVPLVKNQLVTDADLGIQDQSAEIKGTLWDQTENVPIPGVTIYLDLNYDDNYSPGEPYSVTNSSGNYLIAGLPGGTYKAHADNGTLDVIYLRTPVSGSNPTVINLGTGESFNFSLTYAEKSSISGLVQDASGTSWGNIIVYLDLNGNGLYDEGEPVAVTDETGRYIFDKLLPGTYTVRLMDNQLPTEYTFLLMPGTVTIDEGDGSIANFLTALPVNITSFVWEDANGNGRKDPEESGLEGVTVFLDANNNGSLDSGELSTVTDATGAYSFTDLNNGDFYIRVDDSALLNEYILTTATNPVFRVIAPGQTYDGAQFGYQSKLAIVHTLQYPTRLAWGSDGNLYVSDNTTDSVFIYDTTLNLQGELKKLAKPLGVAADGSGNIYVGNQERKNVEVYDSSGNLLKTIGDGFITTPNDIALDRSGNIYVLDSSKDTILVYDQNGTLSKTIGDALQFDYAVSVAINYRDDGSGTEIGELYVADQPNCTIHVFTLDGTYKKSIGTYGSLYTTNWDGKFAGLVAVDTDQYGYIHGLDNSLNVVQVFDPQTGAFVRSYNAYTAANAQVLNLQSDISIHHLDNRVIITNVATKDVEEIATVQVP